MHEINTRKFFLNWTLLIVLSEQLFSVFSVDWDKLNFPAEHSSYHFNSHPELTNACKHDELCPFKKEADLSKCWGYEDNCEVNRRMSVPQCSGTFPHGWAKDRDDQVVQFWKEADFGYIKDRKDELTVLCEPQTPTDSSLKCSRYLRYCEVKNIFIDLTHVDFANNRDRFQENLFEKGQIGGRCQLSVDKLEAENEHKSPLQSWYAELENFTALNESSMQCDVVLDKPTWLIKLDAGVNMYHHFCDFVNLYASQHLNGSFSTDVNIIMWDATQMAYGDFFHETWRVFSDHEIIHLRTYENKKICIKDAVFSLLARMRYGLYYNMPLIPGCHDSSLFRAFSQHVLHRMKVVQHGPLETKVRVTFLARTTKYRRVLNQNELISALKAMDELEVTIVDYNHKFPFPQQLQSTLDSDVFIGMHGAGLTHLLFQPDWGVIFELYNCDDANCYKDLARLRGVNYLTWQNNDLLHQEDAGHHPTMGEHKKFTNYSFDVTEFMRLVMLAVDLVRQHPRFIEQRNLKFAASNQESVLKQEL